MIDLNLNTSVKMKIEEIKFSITLEEVSELAYQDLTSMELSLRTTLGLTAEEYAAYLKTLIARRVSHLNGKRFDKNLYGTFLIPSFVEKILSYLSKYYDENSGYIVGWDEVNYDCLSDDELVKVNNKLRPISKVMNNLVTGFPTKEVTNRDATYIIENDEIVSMSNIDPTNIGVAAFLNQELSSQSASQSPSFRKILANRRFVVQEVYNGFSK